MRRNVALLAVAGAACAVAGSLVLSSCSNGEADHPLSTETLVPVHVGEISRATVRRYVSAYAQIGPEPAGAESLGGGSNLASPVAGIVAEVLCSEGKSVDEGELLFRLDSRIADVAVEFASRELDRQQVLIRTGGTSQQALDEAERKLAATRAERELLRIKAPFAGIVSRIDARPGEAVNPGSVLGELSDPDGLVATAGVPAFELADLRPGQFVRVKPADRPPVDGTLLYVSQRLDPTTGLAPVRVSIPAGSGLRAGEFVAIEIVSDERKDRLVVPVESVVRGEDGTSEIAVVEGDRARRMPVVAGLRDGDVVEVEGDGLKEGMRVVTTGVYGLPPESRIRILP